MPFCRRKGSAAGELMHLEGIVVLGQMPPGLEIITTFSGAVCATSTAPDAARALLEYVGSPAADPSRLQNGMERA